MPDHTSETEKQFFTLVFEGDIRKWTGGNPLKTETPFGVPVAVSVGNALDVIEDLLNPPDYPACPVCEDNACTKKPGCYDAG